MSQYPSLVSRGWASWATAPQEAGGPSRAALSTQDAQMAPSPSECSLKVFAVLSMCLHGTLFLRTEAVTARLGEAGPQCLVGAGVKRSPREGRGGGKEGGGERQSRFDSVSTTDTSFPSETNPPAALGEGLF